MTRQQAARVISERLRQADFAAQPLFLVKREGRMVARDGHAQRRREAPDVPIALVDAERALQQPIAALLAKGRQRGIADLAGEIDGELRAEAPANFLDDPDPDPLPPESLARIVGPVALDRDVG